MRALLVVGLLLCGSAGWSGELANPFFAMDTGTANGFSEKKIGMLADVGYSGVDFSALGFFDRSMDQLPEVLAAIDANGLGLYAVYLDVGIDGGACPSDVRRAIDLLQGREEPVIWAALRSERHEPGSADGDATAVSTIQAIADAAAGAGLQVALYPHTGYYAERVSDNVRLARMAGRANVGVTWNLSHWLRVERGRDFETTAALALPYLIRVTINGADVPEGDLGWDRLIQPLDAGSYDVYTFVARLRAMGYSGPIGLQGYGIEGEKRTNLARSLAAWKAFQQRFERENP